VLRHAGMSSVLIGASRVSQIDAAVMSLERLELDSDELRMIEGILAGQEV
jgi:aryl-alcohol dehydrogenase-like predicted oxidoreductase